MIDEIFPERLKQARNDKNITQQQLSDIINSDFYELDKKVSRVSIAKYERGDTKPNMNTLSAISHALDVDVNYLLGKTQKKHIQITNESLNILISVLNNIIYEDNTKINYTLWSIISTLSNSIKQSVEYDLIDSYKNILKVIDSTINRSVNSGDFEPLENLENLMLNNYKAYMNRVKEDVEKEFIAKRITNALELVKLCGINELSTNDKQILKEYYSNYNTDNIPDCIKELFE